MSQYVYHFKPKCMFSDRLIPLNRLKDNHPSEYAEHIKKYKGREHLLQKTIPILNCLWNDALHISPISPQRILDTWKAEGLHQHARVADSIDVYKIPVNFLEEKTTVCYQSFNFDFHAYNPELDNTWKFQKSLFKEQNEVDSKQIDIWKSDLKNERPFFWYSHTMHILAQQEIDISSCELIICK